jgi:fimbrial chaperone protein
MKPGDSSKTFSVENPGAESIALKIEATTREHDLLGKETRTPTKDFSIFPEQMILKANEKKNIRVSWIAQNELTKELAYRLVVTQVPVNLTKEAPLKRGASLKFLMQYVASLYVTPEKAQPLLTVESFKMIGKNKAELILFNGGNKHQKLTDLSLRIRPRKSAPDSGIVLTPKELSKLSVENVLAGSKRKFILEPIDPKTSEKDLLAEVEF